MAGNSSGEDFLVHLIHTYRYVYKVSADYPATINGSIPRFKITRTTLVLLCMSNA